MSVKKFKFVSPGIFIDEIDNSQVPKVSPDVGPVIVGRSERGPAMRPVRVESFSDFVSIFGNPIPGKGTPDAWRDGNKSGPTYGAYAAQAYLKNNGPITYVRLLGDESTNKTAAAAAGAGWQAGDGSGLAVGRNAGGSNGGAMGLFIFDSGSTDGVLATVELAATGASTVDTFINITDAAGTTIAYTAKAAEALYTNPPGFKQGGTVAEQATSLAACITQAHSGALTATAGGTSAICQITQSLNGTSGNKGFALSDDDGFTIPAAFTGGTADAQNASGTLAAIWYLTEGAIALSGASDMGEYPLTTNTGSCALIRAVGDKEFTGIIANAASASVVKQVFNFNPSSDQYIRKVFNTDPTLTNSEITPAEGLRTYWLGETFDRNVTERISNSSATTVLGMILPIQGASVATADGADFKQAFRPARTGWVFSQDLVTGSGYAPMDSARVKQLFRFRSLGVGSG